MVVQEKMKSLIGVLKPVLSDEQVPLEEKVYTITESYTTLVLENEDLPLFILNELSVNKELFVEVTRSTRLMAQPIIEKQLKERGSEMLASDFIVNMLGLIMFPFVAKPLLISSGLIKEEFIDFVTRRKENILEWVLKMNK